MGIFAFVFASIMALVALMVFFYNRAAKEARGGHNDLTLKLSNNAGVWSYVEAFYILKVKAALRIASHCVNRMMIKCGLTPKTLRVRIKHTLRNDDLDRGEVSHAEILMALLYGHEQIWVERVIRRGDVVQLWPGTWCTFDGKRVAWAGRQWDGDSKCWFFGFLNMANCPWGNTENVAYGDFVTHSSEASKVFEGLPKAEILGIGQD